MRSALVDLENWQSGRSGAKVGVAGKGANRLTAEITSRNLIKPIKISWDFARDDLDELYAVIFVATTRCTRRTSVPELRRTEGNLESWNGDQILRKWVGTKVASPLDKPR